MMRGGGKEGRWRQEGGGKGTPKYCIGKKRDASNISFSGSCERFELNQHGESSVYTAAQSHRPFVRLLVRIIVHRIDVTNSRALDTFSAPKSRTEPTTRKKPSRPHHHGNQNGEADEMLAFSHTDTRKTHLVHFLSRCLSMFLDWMRPVGLLELS